MNTGHAALLLALVAGIGATPPALAQTPADAGTRYFEGEYTSSIGWLSVGVAGVAAGAALLAVGDDDALEGAGYPLVIFGGLQTVFGTWVGLASRSRAADLRARFAAAPEATLNAEIARMDGVITSFHLIEALEVAAIGAGLLTALVGVLDDNDIALGVGAGLAVEAAATLALDSWAESRSARYRNSLQTFFAAHDSGLVLGAAGSF